MVATCDKNGMRVEQPQQTLKFIRKISTFQKKKGNHRENQQTSRSGSARSD